MSAASSPPTSRRASAAAPSAASSRARPRTARTAAAPAAAAAATSAGTRARRWRRRGGGPEPDQGFQSGQRRSRDRGAQRLALRVRSRRGRRARRARARPQRRLERGEHQQRQHGGDDRARPGPPRGRDHAGTGTDDERQPTSNCVPWPAALSTVMSPPCCLTIWNTIASPSPVPARPAAASGSNSRRCSSRADAAALVAHAQHEVALHRAAARSAASTARHRLEAVPGQVPEHLRDLVGIGDADVRALVGLEADHVVGPTSLPLRSSVTADSTTGSRSTARRGLPGARAW